MQNGPVSRHGLFWTIVPVERDRSAAIRAENMVPFGKSRSGGSVVTPVLGGERACEVEVVSTSPNRIVGKHQPERRSLANCDSRRWCEAIRGR